MFVLSLTCLIHCFNDKYQCGLSESFSWLADELELAMLEEVEWLPELIINCNSIFFKLMQYWVESVDANKQAEDSYCLISRH